MKYFPLDINLLSPFFCPDKTGILLDSSRCSNSNHFSYLFLDPLEKLFTYNYDNVKKLLLKIDTYKKAKWVCGFISYEASYAFEDKFQSSGQKYDNLLPLIWFAVFDRPWIFDHSNGTWDRPLPVNTNENNTENHLNNYYNPPIIKHLISKNEFNQAIETIKKNIKAGETYQVNYTYNVSVQSGLSHFDLYRYLRKNQTTPYSAFIQNEFGCIASFSPELFFSKSGKNIRVKPMKGTAPRGISNEEDKRICTFLQNDIKNRAENLMIVDLLRNDLGRICIPGSIKTEKLYDIETHKTVHQMTSTVVGSLIPRIQFSDIIKNIFPCGSVTGAPKIKTMEIIKMLEHGQRGVYCGAIGFITPKGDAKFNVPIRTLQKGKDNTHWLYRVGSGIIWDSSVEDEWKECGYKCQFLKIAANEFEIVETLLYHNRFLYKKEHIQRMMSSANYFDFPFDENYILKTMKDIEDELEYNREYKVRILLNKKGKLSCEKSEINHSSKTSSVLLFSNIPVDKQNIFLFHKTNYRPWFEKAMNNIKANRCYDMVFCNLQGQITEGARSNIFIEKNGRMYTPPLSCGLLPGILRKVLLNKKKCYEKILLPEDILNAEKIYCGNSVRGLTAVNPLEYKGLTPVNPNTKRGLTPVNPLE